MINDIIGEKRTDLAYPNRGKEVAVVSVFSDNIQYEFTEPHNAELGLRNMRITAGTYTRRELINIVEGKIELTQFDKNPRIKRTNKLSGITEVVFKLNELDNTNNLENGAPSNTLLTYHVTAYDDSTHFKPYTLQHKKLKNGDGVCIHDIENKTCEE